jgi:hypothetical protein
MMVARRRTPRPQQFCQRQLGADKNVFRRQLCPDRIERLEPVKQHSILRRRNHTLSASEKRRWVLTNPGSINPPVCVEALHLSGLKRKGQLPMWPQPRRWLPCNHHSTVRNYGRSFVHRHQQISMLNTQQIHSILWEARKAGTVRLTAHPASCQVRYQIQQKMGNFMDC